MREGPLAALFRKTEDDEATDAGARAAGADAQETATERTPRSQTPQTSAARDERGVPHPALSASVRQAEEAQMPAEAGVPSPRIASSMRSPPRSPRA